MSRFRKEGDSFTTGGRRRRRKKRRRRRRRRRKRRRRRSSISILLSAARGRKRRDWERERERGKNISDVCFPPLLSGTNVLVSPSMHDSNCALKEKRTCGSFPNAFRNPGLPYFSHKSSGKTTVCAVKQSSIYLSVLPPAIMQLRPPLSLSLSLAISNDYYCC